MRRATSAASKALSPPFARFPMSASISDGLGIEPQISRKKRSELPSEGFPTRLSMAKVGWFYNCAGKRTMRGLLIGFSLLLAAAPAHAAVTAFGSSLARDCFENAQTGTKDEGIEACGKALQ